MSEMERGRFQSDGNVRGGRGTNNKGRARGRGRGRGGGSGGSGPQDEDYSGEGGNFQQCRNKGGRGGGRVSGGRSNTRKPRYNPNHIEGMPQHSENDFQPTSSQDSRSRQQQKQSDYSSRGTYSHQNSGSYNGRQNQAGRGSNIRSRNSKSRQQNGAASAGPAAAMTVLVHRINLVDGWSAYGHSENRSADRQDGGSQQPHPSAAFVLPTNCLQIEGANIAPYAFISEEQAKLELGTVSAPDAIEDGGSGFFDSFGGGETVPPSNTSASIAVAYAPVSTEYGRRSSAMVLLNDNNAVPNPHLPDEVHDKYWSQRKRLFSRFDEGIQLDPQGWYSVTPEAIADHVARRLGEAASIIVEQGDTQGREVEGAPASFFGNDGIIILDAFCGCGGNSIAFGKLSPFSVSKIVCCEMDLVKLRHAAHNAAIYGISPDKLQFIWCNSLYVMDACYRDGRLVKEALPDSMSSTFREECEGFTIGGLDMLPSHIDSIFMDPPWGGVDYNQAGKNGYDLAKHIRMPYDASTAAAGPMATAEEAAPPSGATVIDGEQLLKMAARATKSKFVVYDVPRNTNKQSLAKAAISAGYCGNFKLEEYYLNGRLKTTTAYFGWDYSPASGRLSVLRS